MVIIYQFIILMNCRADFWCMYAKVSRIGGSGILLSSNISRS